MHKPLATLYVVLDGSCCMYKPPLLRRPLEIISYNNLKLISTSSAIVEQYNELLYSNEDKVIHPFSFVLSKKQYRNNLDILFE